MNEPAFHMPQGGGKRHDILRSLVKYLNKTYVSVLEIGSFEGQSALVWGAAIKEYCSDGGELLCVDPWQPYHSAAMLNAGGLYTSMDAGLKDGSVYERFLKNIEGVDPSVEVSHLRGSLSEVYPSISKPAFGFDIVYVDGDHTSSGVAADIALGKTLVSKGGLICGDDLEAQWEGCDHEQALANAESSDYAYGYHPGVTVAVGKAFQGLVWMKNGVWVMQKENGKWKIPMSLSELTG